MTNQDYLIHYGVLGMKWGVRKDRGSNRKDRKRLYKSIKKAYKKQTGMNPSGKEFRKSIQKHSSKLRSSYENYDIASDKEEKAYQEAAKKYNSQAIKIVKSHWDPSDGTADSNNHIFNKYVGYELDALISKDPSFKKVVQDADKASDIFSKESKAIAKDLLGKYGSKKINTIRANTTVRLKAEDILSQDLRLVTMQEFYKNKYKK